jgi:Ca-activated chloride channel homolog
MKKSNTVLSYFRATDLLISAVTAMKKGDGVTAAKMLHKAIQDPQIDEAMQQLDEQQEQAMQGQQTVEEQTSRTLARLIQSSQQQQQEGDDQESDEEDEGEDEQQEEENADLVEDLDFGVEDEEIEGDDQVVEDQSQQQVQASVSKRLERARLNKKARA